MPLSYSVSRAEELVYVTATGEVLSRDPKKMADSLVADENILPGMRFLVEASDVTPHLTFTDLQEAAGGLKDLSRKGVREIAIVADKAHIYALAKVFAVFASGAPMEVKVFQKRRDAMSWLNEHANGDGS